MFVFTLIHFYFFNELMGQFTFNAPYGNNLVIRKAHASLPQGSVCSLDVTGTFPLQILKDAVV